MRFETFGINSFNEEMMQKRLPHPIYVKWQETIRKKDALDQNTADAIAHAMKEWAIEKGCTHYSHWFQPLNGLTAEKHEAFIDCKEGKPLICFSGKELIKGEPDASSFPSGGLRATFEARGYTYWDCSSYAFIRDKTLFIPTIFLSFNGESLDLKTPLLRSVAAISKEATALYNLLCEEKIEEVIPHVGLEQEYFLVDRDLFLKRRDLVLTGHTLFGSLPPKAQELESHYFGSIPQRVQSFMEEVDEELWKLGIYAKSEHNEVAPAQFEIAPIFCNVNVAVDQNQIIMEVLQKIALKHNLVCLLHEKPFKNINGSGKHNNWSLITDRGKNLLELPENFKEDQTFIVFLAAIIKAIDEHAELIRLGSSNVGNDYRLGGSEAPPSIVSMFLGKPLEDYLLDLVSGNKTKDHQIDKIKLDFLTEVPFDFADRNRTSPVAFTGNKIEFRMLGSSMNAATFNTYINTIVAHSLKEIRNELAPFKDRVSLKNATLDLCKTIIKKHQKVLFNGDGYSSKWIEEAKKRKLPNIKNFFEAINYLTLDKNEKIFIEQKVFSKAELSARKEVLLENHNKLQLIDIKTVLLCLYRDILPKLNREIKEIPDYDFRHEMFQETVKQLLEKAQQLEKLLENSDSDNQQELGNKIIIELLPLKEDIRKLYDKVEDKISDENLPFPTYMDYFFGLDS